jgi:hypothetical protein
VPCKYLNPYGSPHSTYANLVVSNRSGITDRTYASPENSSRKVEPPPEKSGEGFNSTGPLVKKDRRNITVKTTRESTAKFKPPQHMLVNKSTAYEQTLSQQQLAKGDWPPGECTKKYIKNPHKNSNNEKYQCMFQSKTKFALQKKMSVS